MPVLVGAQSTSRIGSGREVSRNSRLPVPRSGVDEQAVVIDEPVLNERLRKVAAAEHVMKPASVT